jgi:two-component system chemotaxis response regulator CheY
MKILIVDNSAFMRQILKSILLKEFPTAEILEAEDGAQGVEKYTAEKPDIMLLDLIMPVKDGIGVLKEIGNSVKVIVVSAVGQEKMIEEAKSLGAKAFIVKPFDARNVIEIFKGVIGTV